MLMLHPEPPPLLALETLSDADEVESPVYSPAPSNSSAYSEYTEVDWDKNWSEEPDATQERQEGENGWWDDGSRVDLCEILASVGLRKFYWWFSNHGLGTARRLARYVDGKIMRNCEEAGMTREEACRFTKVFSVMRDTL